MCRLRNTAMRDYQESATTGQTDTQTDAGQSDPYVPLCFTGDTKIHAQLPCISAITTDYLDFASYENLPFTLLTKVLGSFSSELSSPLLKITK